MKTIRHSSARAALSGVSFAIFVAIVPAALAAATPPEKVAAQADALLAKESFGAGKDTSATAAKPPGRADDEIFLRRASLDLVGEPPSPSEIAAFALDATPNKRHQAVERLLANEKFGQNWARYWRDVIFYRRTEDRTLIAAHGLVEYMAKQFNAGGHWDQIARDFITATGDVREKGNTAIIMAQMADPNDTAAEVSRIFLGIQIQCAQCHNHPSDRWKRNQFHELAAFFPRIGIRPGVAAGAPTFNVVSLNRGKAKRAPGATDPVELEHYMPDLKNPKAKGKLTQPVFFATGQKLELGLSDEDRRAKLAQWLTSSSDRWFAKAYVNRMWSELVGHGFYEPVDDLGPDRKCSAPQTLDYLATQFSASHYDVKWLFRVILATDAYARETRSRSDLTQAPMAAGHPQRLRADQLFNSVVDALGISEQAPIGPGGPKKQGQRELFGGPRGVVLQTFGYDPSVRRDDVAGSIPQALWMMNSGELNRALTANRGNTLLAQVLAEAKGDNEAVVNELYLRCLAREPKPAEIETCLSHVRSSKSRTEGFEDIVWSLVNSTEFLYRK